MTYNREVWIPDTFWSLPNIFSIAVDSNHNVYCTTGFQTLWKLNKQKDYPQLLLKVPRGELTGIVYHRTNNTLYICDIQNHRILSYPIDSRKITVVAGTGMKGHTDGNLLSAEFCLPRSIAIDNNEDLIILEWGHIRKISFSDGKVSTVALGTSYWAENASLTGDARIASASNRAFYVAESQRLFLFYWTEYGSYYPKGVNITLKQAGDVCCRPNGSLLVCDKRTAIFVISDNSGRYISRDAISKLNIGKIDKPTAMCFVDNDSMYVADENGLFKVGGLWSVERLLWIGKYKEEATYCVLALLPRETVREITSFVRFALLE